MKKRRRFRLNAVETLECRLLRAGITGQPGTFEVAGQTHSVTITNVIQDADGNGIVRDAQLTLSGRIQNVGSTAPLPLGHAGVSLSVSGEGVTGSVSSFTDSNPGSTFELTVNLPAVDSHTANPSYNFEFAIERTGFGSIPIVGLSGEFTLDRQPPTVASVDVAGRDVTISLTDFTTVTGLLRNDITIIGPDSLSVTLGNEPIPLGGNRFRFTMPDTAADGEYELSIAPNAVSDAAGNQGPLAEFRGDFEMNTVPPVAGELVLVNETNRLADLRYTNGQDVELQMSFSSDTVTVDFVLTPETGPVLTQQVANGAAGTSVNVTFANVAEGRYQALAMLTDKDGLSSQSAPISLEVDRTAPTPLVLQLVGDSNGDGIVRTVDAALTVIRSAGEANSTIIVAKSSAGVLTPLGESNDATFIINTALADGTHVLEFTETDVAGNSTLTTIMAQVDNTVPVVDLLRDPATNRILAIGDLYPGSNLPGVVLSTEGAATASLQLPFQVIEQRFASTSHDIRLQLVPLIYATPELSAVTALATLPQGADELVSTSSLPGADPVISAQLAPGNYAFAIRATDGAGNVSTTSTTSPFWVTVVNDQADATHLAPQTPVYTEQFDLRTILSSIGAPGTLDQVWQMSFDKTTQTVWFNAELGNITGVFDPATGQVRAYDLGPISNNANGSNPHGIFFDFNTHLRPRVWIANRNAGGGSAGVAAESTLGQLSYLDVVSGQVFSYEFPDHIPDNDGNELHLDDFHAVFVDSTGTVWVVSDHGNAILEFEFDNRSSSEINGSIANLNVHLVPDELRAGFGTDFAPHGLEVAVDDRTGEKYVWFIAEGGSGRVGLLRPSATGTGDNRWMTWDVPNQFEGGRGTFVKIDDNETPGIPQDDRIVATFPVARPPLAGGGGGGGGGGGNNPGGSPIDTMGLTYLLDPGTEIINPNDHSIPTTLTGWIVPKPPGAAGKEAAINQAFVNRLGGILYVDRLGAVGRLDPAAANDLVIADNVPLSSLSVETPPTATVTNILPTRVEVVQSISGVAPVRATAGSAPADNADDRSSVSGLNQYDVAGPNSGGNKGQGLFRGTVNATGVVYGAISQNDFISTTVFAESDRRQMSTVVSPITAPAGAVEGRMVFQVLRDGSLVLTARANGQILDQQVNLTAAAASPLSSDVRTIFGDVSATAFSDGRVQVVGKAASDGIVVYTFTPTSDTDWLDTAKLLQNWSVQAFTNPVAADGILISNPTTIEENGRVVALLATNHGHLIRYVISPTGQTATRQDLSQNIPPADLAERSFYAEVGVIQQAGATYVYGTNQQGQVVELRYATGTGIVQSVRTLPISGATRETMVFQSLNAVLDQFGHRHLYAQDGHSRLVHLELDANGNVVDAENVTAKIIAADQAFGYFDFQEPYAARTYSDLTVLVHPDANDGRQFVYGTTGGELILFVRSKDGDWSAHNLTNDIYSIYGDAVDRSVPGVPNTRVPANSVFGSPAGYILPDGDRHIFQINAEGEVVEYYIQFDATSSQPSRFHTQNINLRTGSSPTALSQSPATVPKVFAGDFNGDGRDDRLTIQNGAWSVSLSNGTSFETGSAGAIWNGSAAGYADVQVADANGDGRDDLIGRDEQGRWWVARATDSGFTNEIWGRWSTATEWSDVQAIDVDGDGDDDIVGRAGDGSLWVANSNAAGVLRNQYWGRLSKAVAWRDVLVGDFDGDGLGDIVARAADSSWWVQRSTGTHFVTSIWTRWSSHITWTEILVGDLNGDGRDDILGRAHDGRWWAGYSTGRKFRTQAYAKWSVNADWRNIQLADIDGDGRHDVIGQSAGGDWWASALGDDARVHTFSFGSWPVSPVRVAVSSGDLNGDGIDDLVSISHDRWQVSLVQNSRLREFDWGLWSADLADDFAEAIDEILAT